MNNPTLALNASGQARQHYYYRNGESDRNQILSGTGRNLTLSIPELERRLQNPLLSDTLLERY